MQRRTAYKNDAVLTQLRGGYTLLELVISLGAGTILLVGMTSSIIIATQAVSPPGPQADVLDAAEITFIIEDELESAIHVSKYRDSGIDFITSDRDLDGQEESIAYQWNIDGTQALTRAANGESGVALLPNVHSLNITPRLLNVTENIGGEVIESSESSFIWLTSTSHWATWHLDSFQPVGMAFDLAHPEETALWSINGVWLVMRRGSSHYSADDSAAVQVRLATGDGLPTSEVLAETTIRAADLSNSYSWKYFDLDGAERILPEQRVCLVVQPATPASVIEVLYADDGVSTEQTLVAQSTYGGGWHLFTGQSLLNAVRGTRHTMDNTSHEVVRNYISACTVELQMTEDPATRVRRGIRLLNSPEDVDQFWSCDFSDSALDEWESNFDEVPDWNLNTTVPIIAERVMQLAADQQISTNPPHRLSGLITIDARCRATSSALDGGTALTIPVGGGAFGNGLLKCVVTLNSSGLQTVSLLDVAGTNENDLAVVNGLSNDFVDLRIVIDPSADQVAVWVNGMAQGRSTFSRSSSAMDGRIVISSDGASAEYDYISIRVGKDER